MGPEHPSFFHSARSRVLRAILGNRSPSTQSELARVIEQASHDDVINAEMGNMIRGVFDITTHRVSDIMIPRSQMITISSDSTISQAIEIVKTSGHSRYPVFLEDKDHIQGILMAKDLLTIAHESEHKLNEFSNIFRKPVIVPESKRVNTMLKEFQKDRFHMAIVVDEYGGICGLVTIEDIIELIVGEINDEYEEQDNTADIVKTGDNVYTVLGSTPIEDFVKQFKISLPDVDIDTVAGLIIHSLGHIPHKDESITIANLHCKVLNANSHQVQLIQVTLEKQE